MKDRRFSYSLTIEGVVFDITAITDSSTLSVMSALCSTKKKSAKNNMNVSLKGGANPTFYATFMQALLESQANNTIKDCLFIVTDTTSNTVLFNGYLDNSEIEINSKHFPDSLELSALDKTMLLDNKIRYNRHWENTSRNQIVEDLIDAMEEDTGKTISLLSTDLSDTDKIGNYSVSEDSNKTYRDIIDMILFEAVGYVIVYDPQNDGYRIKRIPTTLDENTTYREVKYMVNNGLKTKSVLYENDGVLLSYPTIVTRQNTNLYFENIGLKVDDNGKLKGDTVYSGQYYPKDGDVKVIYQNYRIADRPYVSGESRLQNEDLKLLYAKDVSYDLASNPQLSLAPALPNIDWDGTPKFYPNKAWLLFRNDNSPLYIASEDTSVDDSKTYYIKSGETYTPIENPSSDANPKQNGWYEEQGSNVTTFSLTGTAIYVDYMNKLTVPNLCQNPEEYEVQTITDADKAKAFAQWYYNSQRYGGTTSQWNEPEGYSTLGEIVYVVHKQTGIQMPHVIVQMTDECAGGASGTIRMKKIVAISLYGWQEYTASTVTANRNGSNTSSEQTPARWTNGTALWGESTARGWEGNAGDYYLNTENYNLYRCTTSGTSITALWTYVGNIKGADADINANTYTIEYSLSTSPSEYIYPLETINYEDDEDFGSIDNDPDSSTYGEETSYGLRDQVWLTTTEGWYKGLYVWQRLKTTDADGEVTYGEPTYAKSTTEALINGCVLDIVVIDSDGDGDTHTWEKNLADSTTDVLLQFKLVARSYQSITAFKSAIESLSLSFHRASATISTVVLTEETPSSESFDDTNNLVTLTYSYTFKKNVNADSIVINAKIEDSYLKEDGTTYTLETTESSTLNSVDVTEFDAFGGLFATDAIAEQYFQEQNGGLLDGYTYAVSDTNSANYLSLRTHINGSWVSLSTSGLPSTRISGICSKAQQTVLSMVQTGSVTATDYGYFNILIANVVTADFIGAKKINLKDNGLIWGGSVTLQNDVPVKNAEGFYTIDDDGGFVIDSDGLMQAVGAKFEKITIGRESKLYGEVINSTSGGTEVFRTVMDTGDPTTIVGASTGTSNYLISEWKTHLLSWMPSNMSVNTRYTISGTFRRWSEGVVSTTIVEGIRLTSLGSSTTSYPQSNPYSAQTTTLYSNAFSKKTIVLNSVSVKRQIDYHATASYASRYIHQAIRVYIRKSDNTEQDLWNESAWTAPSANSDAKSRTFSSLGIPSGATLYVTFGAGAYSIEQAGSATVSYSDADNWTVGINVVDTSGTTYNMNNYLQSDSSGNPIYLETDDSFTVGSATTSMSSALIPYYKLSYSTPPSGTLISSLFQSKTFTWNSQTLSSSVLAINATTSAITIITSDDTYTFRTGSFATKGSFSFSFSTLTDALGAKAKNLMPIDSNGDLGASGSKAWNNIHYNNLVNDSKREMKENIEHYSRIAKDIINSIEVVSFNYKTDASKTRKIGFIADDTDADVAGKDHDRMDINNCVGVLIKAVQELSAEIEELKNGGNE